MLLHVFYAKKQNVYNLILWGTSITCDYRHNEWIVTTMRNRQTVFSANHLNKFVFVFGCRKGSFFHGDGLVRYFECCEEEFNWLECSTGISENYI